MHLTYRYRVKNLNGLLNKQARAVNFVWNYCNETQRSCLRLGRKWVTAYDLTALVAGTSTELGLHSETIRAVCQEYVTSRARNKRRYLRWRSRKSLGWVPVKGVCLSRKGEGFKFHGRIFRVFDSRPLPAGKICDGSSFSRDARGRWYLNVVIDVPAGVQRDIQARVGIDMGLKHLAVLSTGDKIENPRHFQALEDRIGRAQRAHKKRLVRTLQAKAVNSRRDFAHKATTDLFRRFDYIALGRTNTAALSQTRMAKSVSDAAWALIRRQLAYKAIKHGAQYVEVNESYSTQVCSSCGALPEGRPEGIADLGMRSWMCSECGASHDRDVNAAINILTASGRGGPAVGAAVARRGNVNSPPRGNRGRKSAARAALSEEGGNE